MLFLSPGEELLGIFVSPEQYATYWQPYTQASLDMCTVPSFTLGAHRGERVVTMRPDPYRTDPSILTTEDVAAALQISKKAVYTLIHSGELGCFRRGRQYLIRKADLQAYQAKIEKKPHANKFEVELPQSIIDSFARHLAAEIRKYYDTEEGQSVFTEWLKQQEDT